MKVKNLVQLRYRRHANGVLVKLLSKLLSKSATHAFIEEDNKVLLNGKPKRCMVVRIYGDWE